MKKYCFTLLIGLLTSIILRASDVVSPYSIVPLPQKIAILSEMTAGIDSGWTITADFSDEYDNFTANYLKNEINSISNNMVRPSMIGLKEGFGSRVIYIGNPNQNGIIKKICELKEVDILELADKGFNQGYVLHIDRDVIIVAADSAAGRFYGVVSLIWLFKYSDGKILLPNTRIIDWPNIEIRGFYGSSSTVDRYPPFYNNHEEWIDYLARHKYNMWLSSLSNLGESPSAGAINRLNNRLDYILKRHFHTAYGSSPQSIRYVKEEYMEGVYAKDVRLKFNEDGAAEPLNEVELLANPDFEIDSDLDGVPDGWRYTNNGVNSTWSRDYSDKISGDVSMKLTVPQNLTSSSGQLRSDPFDLEPNQTYALVFWAKKTQNQIDYRNNPQVTVVLRDKDANNILTVSRVIEDTDSWNKYTLVFNTFEDAYNVYIYSRANMTPALEFWLDNMQLIRVNKQLINVVAISGSYIDLYNDNRTRKYVEGVDYTLEFEGELDRIDIMNGRKLVVRRNPAGSIPAGSYALADYDFQVNHQQKRDDGVSLCEPAVLHEYSKRVGPTLELVKPDFFFIGMDEVRGFNRDSRAIKLNRENYRVMADFLNNTIDIIHSFSPTTKVLIWDDMINPYHNGGNEKYQMTFGGKYGNTADALPLIKKENVALICWWYSADTRGKMANSPALYEDLGFEFFGGPWHDTDNIKMWAEIVRNSDNAIGLIDHEFYNDVSGVITAANYAWNGIGYKELEGVNTGQNQISSNADENKLFVYDNLISPKGRKQAFIEVSIMNACDIRLLIYDSAGREVFELENGSLPSGVFRYTWDGMNSSGQKVGSGVYMVHMKAGSYTDTKKIVIIK